MDLSRTPPIQASTIQYLRLPFFQVLAVASGKSHTLALTESQRIYAFGSNSEGQLGVGVDAVGGEFSESPLEVTLHGDKIEAEEDEDIVALAAGSMHSLALTKSGRVWAWGSNKEGQLGVGDEALAEG